MHLLLFFIAGWFIMTTAITVAAAITFTIGDGILTFLTSITVLGIILRYIKQKTDSRD